MLVTRPENFAPGGYFAATPSHGIGLELLHAQADALGLRIEPDHLDLDLLADLQRLGRMIDAPPGDVGDMQQPIDAAEIDEGAVVGDVLHHAVEDLAFLKALDQLARAARRGSPPAPRGARPTMLPRARSILRIWNGCGEPISGTDVAHGPDIDLAAGQERHGAAEIDGEAALHPAVDRAVDPLLGLERLLEVGPSLLAPRLLARQDDRAIPVFVALDIEFDDIAGLDFGLACQAGRIP